MILLYVVHDVTRNMAEHEAQTAMFLVTCLRHNFRILNFHLVCLKGLHDM